MNWFNTFGGGFNDFGGNRYGGGNYAGGNTGWGGFNGSGNAATLPNPNTPPNYYGASFDNSFKNAGWGGFHGGWGNSGGFDSTFNEPLAQQPYDNFLLNVYDQPKLVANRVSRRSGEDVISSIGPAGFWGRSNYPGSLYGNGSNYGS
jgi:hypothetical protein